MAATAQMIPDTTLQAINHVFSNWEDNNPPSHKRLDGKVAIITGGARGIGEATVRLFAKHGAKVVIADVEDTLGTALAETLSVLSPSSDVSFVHCDVSSEDDVENLINSTVTRYGRVDILFNNAGVLGDQSKHKSIVDFDVDDFDRVMRVNVRGVALGIKHAARAMIKRADAAGINSGGGCIISTASVAGVMGGMGPHAYTASKHAIVGLTKNAACELGKFGIRVNCISPFGVATSMLVNAWRNNNSSKIHHMEEDEGEDCMMNFGMKPSDREVQKMEEFVNGLANLNGVTLRAKDIAEAALYLASDESRYVSGHNLVVDGGVTISRNCVAL